MLSSNKNRKLKILYMLPITIYWVFNVCKLTLLNVHTLLHCKSLPAITITSVSLFFLKIVNLCVYYSNFFVCCLRWGSPGETRISIQNYANYEIVACRCLIIRLGPNRNSFRS